MFDFLLGRRRKSSMYS